MKKKRFDTKYYALLSKRIRQKDAAAFTELYNATYSDFYRYACYILKDPHLAQDTLQDIYILAYRNISALKYDRLLYQWMRQITYHVCCDYFRRSSNITRHETGDFSAWLDTGGGICSADDSLREIFDRDLYKHAAEWLDELPANVKEAFTLRYQNELKLEEIADFMGCSLSSVKRYIKTAQGHLKTRLEDYRH